MLKRSVLHLAGLLLAISICYPAAAQEVSTDWTRCLNLGNASLDVQISGCTAVLQSPRATTEDRATAHHIRGNAYSGKKDYDRAIADYSEAIRLDPNPNLIKSYSNRGNAYYDKKDYDRAIVDYNEAIRLDPRYAPAYYNRGLAYSHKRDYDRAIADYNQVIGLVPPSAMVYHTRGLAFLALGRREEAIGDFRRALSVNPNHQVSREELKQLGANP
jgi:tetratricopeptide (TPR) repeat protein